MSIMKKYSYIRSILEKFMGSLGIVYDLVFKITEFLFWSTIFF